MTKQSIFLIDDEEGLRTLYCETLADHYNVSAFADGESALTALKTTSDRPCCAIVDYKMSGINGIEFIKIAGEMGFGIPMVILTGMATKDMAIEALHLRVFTILEKPFDPSNLLSTVERAVITHELLHIDEVIMTEHTNLVVNLKEHNKVAEMRAIKVENVLWQHNIKPDSSLILEFIELFKQERISDKVVSNAEGVIKNLNQRKVDLLERLKAYRDTKTPSNA